MIAPIEARGAGPSVPQTAIERMLLEDGFAIDHAADAGEAARRFASEEHDMVILTHEHPTLEVMTGARAVHGLRVRAAQEGRRYVPVLMLSSAPEQAALFEAKTLGADDILPLTAIPQVTLLRLRAYLALSARGERRSSYPGHPGPGLLGALRGGGEKASLRHDLTQRLVHDLRNPLAGLSSNLAYVDDRLGTGADPEVLEALADCRAAVGRLRRAATMLVDLGRLEEGTLEPRRMLTPIAHLVKEVFAQRQHEATLRDLTLVADVPPGLSSSIDSEVAARLLHALLDHALRYSEAGSTVRLRAERIPGTAPGLSERLLLEMVADGEWLPQSERIHIGRGATSSVVSAGLGLHYAHLASLAHGGHIEVHEDPIGATTRTRLTVTL